MLKGTNLIGKPILVYDTGKRLRHTVKDLVFDQDNNQLLGFLLSENSWFSEAQVLPLSKAQIGPDAIVTASASNIMKGDQLVCIQVALKDSEVLKGTQLMTTDGRSLGTVMDLYFDGHTGAIEGYEVSAGIVADTYTGRSFVPAPKTLKIGQDVTFVQPETHLAADPVGGLKSAMQAASDQLNAAAEGAEGALQQVQRMGSKLQNIGQTVQASASETEPTEEEPVKGAVEDTAKGAAQQALEEDQRDLTAIDPAVQEAEGRRSNQTIRTEAGLIIVAAGQTVTKAVIRRAQTYHQTAALLDAVDLPINQEPEHPEAAPDIPPESMAESTPRCLMRQPSPVPRRTTPSGR